MDLGRAHDRTREDALTKPRGEALDLRLHSFSHVERGAIRDVAVRPHGVLPRWRARWVKKALLSDEDERTVGRSPARDLGFALGDLIERPAEVHRPCAKALLGAPRDRAVDRVVELEDARPVAKRTELAAVTVGKTRTGHLVELSGRDIAQVGARRAELVEACYAAARLAPAAEGSQASRERIGDALGPTAWQRPVRHVRHHREHEAEGRGERSVERQHRMRREAGEQSSRAHAAERHASEEARGERAGKAEPRHDEGMPRNADERSERVRGEIVPLRYEWRDQPSIRARVGAEVRRRRIDRALEKNRGAVIERVRERRGRLDPFQSLAREIELAKERRRGAQRMERRADIVHEPREGQLGGAAAAADRVVRFVDRDRVAFARELDSSRQPVRPAADDGGVDHQRTRTRRLIRDQDASAVTTFASSASPAAMTRASPSRNRVFDARNSAARRARLASMGRTTILKAASAASTSDTASGPTR